MCSAYFSFEKNKFALMLMFSLLVAVINLLTNRILWALVAFRRYKTLVDRNKFLITSIFLFSLINSAILILMVRGEYTGPILQSIIGYLFNFDRSMMEVTVYAEFNRQWYMNIGSQLIMNYIVSLIVFPHFHIVLHWVRKVYRRIIAKKAGRPIKNPNFNYCTFYAMSLKALFFAMLYSNSMPIFYLLCLLPFIQGMKTNWMKTNGSMTSRNVEPASSTTTEKTRPASDSNVMSPNPSVVIVVSVQ